MIVSIRKGDYVYLIREATQTDFETLFNVHRAAMRIYVEQLWGWDEGDQRARFSQYFQKSIIQVIERNGLTVGLLDVTDDGFSVTVGNIEVHPDYQGRGIGTAVLNDVLSKATQ